MTDRITPYEEGGDVKERIDEIVASGVDVHFEMLGESVACMFVGEAEIQIFVKKSKLICRLLGIRKP